MEGDCGLLVSVSLGKNLVVHGHQETLLTVLIPCIFLEIQKEKTSYVSVLLVISSFMKLIIKS
jgi:hypothetical protein